MQSAQSLERHDEQTVTGDDHRMINGDLVINQIRGDGDAALDSLTLTVTGKVTNTRTSCRAPGKKNNRKRRRTSRAAGCARGPPR